MGRLNLFADILSIVLLKILAMLYNLLTLKWYSFFSLSLEAVSMVQQNMKLWYAVCLCLYQKLQWRFLFKLDQVFELKQETNIYVLDLKRNFSLINQVK